MTEAAKADPTLGEFRVGITFNPSGDALVNDIKRKSAELIDLVEDYKRQFAGYGEVQRLGSLAQTHFEDAAMWGVKMATKSPPK